VAVMVMVMVMVLVTVVVVLSDRKLSFSLWIDLFCPANSNQGIDLMLPTTT
jgi:hypothetical protein